jgi:predicted AlkP superfamily phosphohydrolase/phosphomutase
MERVVAIGIDGAPWELVDRFIESGSLPNIASLVEGGTSSDLISTEPAVTSPAWKSYSTGKNPGKLGAFWWTHLDFEKKRMTFTSAADFRGKDHWDYIAGSGEKCVVINQPMTYPPPKEFNGIFVSGVPALENDEYTTPRELKRDLVKRYNWRIAPEILLDINPKRGIKSIRRLIDARFDLAEEHLASAGFVQVSVFLIDDVQHYTWRQMKEGRGEFKDSIETVWRQIDGRIGRLRDLMGPEDHMVIFSDHGFSDFKGALYVNEWLGDEHVKRKETSVPHGPGRTSRIVNIANVLHLTPLLKKMMSKDRLRAIQERTREEELDRNEFFEWDQTRALAVGEGPIYINRVLVTDDDEYESLRDSLIEGLTALEHPDTGERVIDRVLRREEAYSGPFVDKAPDLIIIPTLGYTVSSFVSDERRLWASPDTYHNQWSGVHREEGILILWGPEIREGHRLERARIYDVAPTILALKGLPIPDDVDGEVLVEAMKDPERYRKVERIEGGVKETEEVEYSKEEEEAIQKRLESLGYM